MKSCSSSFPCCRMLIFRPLLMLRRSEWRCYIIYMYLFMYACVFINVCMSVHVFKYACVYYYIWLSVFSYVFTSMCDTVCVCVHAFPYVNCVCVYLCTSLCAYIMHAYVYDCMHVYLCEVRGHPFMMSTWRRRGRRSGSVGLMWRGVKEISSMWTSTQEIRALWHHPVFF